ncbi:MAG TPA: hypothetical protein V6D48_13345, partial [Oculatellaceae cyanobacterium]
MPELQVLFVTLAQARHLLTSNWVDFCVADFKGVAYANFVRRSEGFLELPTFQLSNFLDTFKMNGQNIDIA